MVRVFLIIIFTAILLIGSIVQAKEIPFTPLESPFIHGGDGIIRSQFLIQAAVKAPPFLTGFTQEDRDRLIRLEVTLKEFKESVDKRFEQVDKRFGEMITFFWMIVGIFTAITVSTINFALWDRRSMIRPFESKIRELEEGKVNKLLSSLRTLAETDAKVAEVLRRYNLLRVSHSIAPFQGLVLLTTCGRQVIKSMDYETLKSLAPELVSEQGSGGGSG